MRSSSNTGIVRQWIIKPPASSAAEIARALKVSDLLAQVLVNRGLGDAAVAAGFLRPRLADLVRPELMPGADAAVFRIKRALEGGEKITVYGDYDVDGITGTAILWRLLAMLGADVEYYIPHRIEEGYGLNAEAVAGLAKGGTKLLVTVDCGINAVDVSLLAGRLGMDLVITDHHEPSAELPRAAAIVHPALREDYPNKDSSGSMVAFKLAWALANEFRTGRRLEGDLRQFMLDAATLAAVGTVADVVDIRGENRSITSYGLRALPNCRLAGIEALVESARLDGEFNTGHVAFRLAPLLNAAGRMGHARLAVELLTTMDRAHAGKISEYLQDQNVRRRASERKILEQAREVIAARKLDRPGVRGLVLAGRGWHAGVVGIVASRIVEEFCRPAVLICLPAEGSDPGVLAQGSARSIEDFDVLKAIGSCCRHLAAFGGHKMAAGLRLRPENVEPFAADFEHYACRHLEGSDITSKLHIDASVSLGSLESPLVDELRMLEPFGPGNPEPVLATEAVRLASAPRKVGASGSHLQLAVTDGRTSRRCIGFRMGHLEKKLLDGDSFDVAYRPQINTYGGGSCVELVLADVRFDGRGP
jgi:single-stranded-DNA-specific exonuclease